MSLVLSHVSKSYAGKCAIQDISFSVKQGQVFGLLGLNGAGKSTTIRIILDIMEADAGQVLWRDLPAKALPRPTFGYLPEERGLYPNMKVMEQLVLFGRLNGLSISAATERTNAWLNRFEIPDYASKLVRDLSKGNQQKIQFIASMLHGPELLILDEPFSGLDPVNTSLFKSVFRELVDGGTTILFSSHQLDHVEELSHSVGIIHQSNLVLKGAVSDILSAEQPTEIRICASEEAVRAVLAPDVAAAIQTDKRDRWISIPANGIDAEKLLKELIDSGTMVSHFELVRPTLHDIFLGKVGKLG